MSEVSETIPIVVGIVVSLFIVRWIFSKGCAAWIDQFSRAKDNRNPDGPRGISREAVEQLSAMFPNIPLAIVRSELVRSGSTQTAIERLLQLSASYPEAAVATATVEQRPLTTRQDERASSADACRKNTMEALVKIKEFGEARPDEPLPGKVDVESWSKDPALRERMLLRKKQQMLQNARKRFLANADRSESI